MPLNVFAKVAPPPLDSVLDFIPDSEEGFLNPEVSAADSLTNHWLFTSAIPDWITYLLSFSAALAVLSIVIAGAMLMWYPEDNEYKKKAYGLIQSVVFGLIIASLAYTIVQIINAFPTFGTNPASDLVIKPESGVGNLVQGELLTEIIPKSIQFILEIFGVVAFGLFLYAGVLLIIRDGDDDKVKKAKELIIYAFIGIIVALFAYLIIEAVLLLNFERS